MIIMTCLMKIRQKKLPISASFFLAGFANPELPISATFWGVFKSCRYRQLLFPGNFLAGLVLREY